jgi:hypothetical protein
MTVFLPFYVTVAETLMSPGKSTGHSVMENIDRFFDVYERVVPRCFGDVLAAVAVLSLLAWVVI